MSISLSELREELRRLQAEVDAGVGGDHGVLVGLGDNDHPQYRLAATAIAHGTLSGLANNEHPQYQLAAASLPRGALSWVQRTDTTGTFAASTSLLTTPGLVIPAGRRLKVTGFVQLLQGAAAGHIQTYLKQDGVTVQGSTDTAAAGDYMGVTVTVTLVPSAATHLYTLWTGTTSGNVSLQHSADRPCFILVEDIGV